MGVSMMARSRLLQTVAFVALLALCPSTWAQERQESGASEAFVPDRPWEVIDMAIALDTSGSMGQLIEAARLKLWEIVYELSLVEPTPTLRVAIVSYGSQANGAESGYIKVEADFTANLDLASERLFEVVQDNGITEFVARAAQTSVQNLSWTPSEEALKLLFVAGNEPADQDLQVGLEEISDLVLQEGISLQLIFCGHSEDEAAVSWRQLAEWSQGQFATIDKNTGPVSIETPFDVELVELSGALNQTYVPLGERGQERMQKLVEQDEKVRQLSSSAAAGRASVKGARLYSTGWDLVDAVESGQADLFELDEAQLPEALQAMSFREREIHLHEMQAMRQELRERIAVISEQRRRYVTQELEAKGIDTSRAFDTVVRQTIRKKLEERGFQAPEDSG